MARLLIVDDERAIVDTLVRVLERDGHTVAGMTDAARVLDVDLSRFDLIVTDVMMPGMDGFELVRRIRERADCPILFLTAKTEEGDAVMGLGLGADDYIRKPCGAAELRAKVTAHLRREGRERHSSLEFGRVRIDLTAKRAEVDGAPVRLTPTEYALCEHLARRRGQVFSKEALLEEASGWDSTASAETITAHVSSIRSKFKAHGVNPIGTVWGMGYRWEL
ncbi:response regulator transcription factor [Gordonibacter massiliensis (ex Traore et al. 2017)]|uniref:Response regulator transcription factor n=1 Tax=Gordonibacter massiliensis (ex Traore et al. 2017) TaxID=1841863 RepID=A0A842JGE7_9ACTN|nr:response regulator transcription factor [Gordonibacter massiliensis (ex Traore et al. 2017)]MBC2890076.1 response regulator transcription factor [Gordonibacter massiliensis (ex Traore et al. 2017)]MBX9033534.1 response regulator transcription factor [Gordonibacter massiliensis (ex Traore et al. 2017)]